MNYAELVPVLINAIQQQQLIIKQQDEKIKKEQAQNVITSDRLNKLEILVNQINSKQH